MTQPAIRALIAKWRDAAVWEHDDMSNVQAAQTFDQCADELEALLAAGEAAETPQGNYGDLRGQIGLVLRQVEITNHRADNACRYGAQPAPTIQEWRERVAWLVEVLQKTRDAFEDAHLGHLRAASLSPAAPPQEDERVIPPFLHPGYVIRKAKPQPHHGIDCGCADCAIPSTAETPPATDKP